MSSKKAPKKETQVVYIMTLLNGGLRKVTVPESYRVTFGPLTMPKQSKNGRYNDFEQQASRTLCLRFYEGTTQRAVFTDVASFRDDRLKMEERVTRTKRQVVEKNTPTGAKNVEVEARMTEWINADDPEDHADSDKMFLEDKSNRGVEF